ncbi:hypothetical protein GGI35DRAFT_490221 [Trichoderma velutinum]
MRNRNSPAMNALPRASSQWALDSTANGLFTAFRGFLLAATSDNVQVAPLVVCQAFGNTLAMSSQTLRKIETSLLPTPSPAPVAFLKASIGFSPNDCAVALGGTMPGQRFLGLAAALVTSVGPLDGAKAVIAMMEASKFDENHGTFIPSTRHLADILKSLDPRSVRCGFRDIMVTWEVLLRERVFPQAFNSKAEVGNTSARAKLDNVKNLMLKGLPPPETIARIVDAFSQVARLGHESIIGVTIKVGAGAAWVLAFAQWCLDIPPALYIDEKSILDPPGSLVRVTIPASSSNKSIEIIIQHKLELLSSLLSPAVKYTCYGMVSLETYGTWLRHEFGFADKSGRRLLCQLFQYATPQILSNMTCGEFGRLGRNSNLVEKFSVSDPLDSYRPTTLPDISKLQYLCNIITGETVSQRFTMLQDGELIENLPLVKLHVDHLEEKCRCAECYQRDEAHSSNSEACAVDEFYSNFSTILVNVFALSLFDSPESLLIRPSHSRHDGHQLEDDVCDILWTGEAREFDDEHLLQWARAMVGHDFDNEDRGLIVTSGRGQVVYPLVYETQHIERAGYLRLLNFCGVLKYEGDVYNVVVSPDNDESDVSDDWSDVSEDQEQNIYEVKQEFGVLQPMNLYQNARLSWKIATHENGEIQADFLVRVQGSSFTATRNPSFFITALKGTLFYESCPHESRAKLKKADRFTTNQLPWHERVGKPAAESFVNIIAVDGSEGLRCFALAHANGPVVLRGHACLRCCLDMCRKNAVNALIL